MVYQKGYLAIHKATTDLNYLQIKMLDAHPSHMLESCTDSGAGNLLPPPLQFPLLPAEAT